MRIITFASLLALLVSPNVRSADYAIVPKNDADTVTFNSTAKLEFIQGTTQDIEGGFSFDPSNPDGKVSGVLKVDLRTLRTGIEKRDEHMRDKHLHTKDYPYAYFEIKSVAPFPALTKFDSVYVVKAIGNFYIHGNYREVEAALQLVRKRLLSGLEAVDVRAKFSMELDKFKIPRPKALFLKLAETIEVEAVFTALQASAPSSLALPDWPKLN